MVRQRANSITAYRASKEVPETPLTPRTPRSPHLHRSRLLSPTLSTRTALKRSHDDDIDIDADFTDTHRLASLPNANPTPSEMLSLDMHTLALHHIIGPNNGSSSSSRRDSGVGARDLSTPSAKLSDQGIEHMSLSLPFEQIRQSPRTLLSPRKTTPVKSNSNLRDEDAISAVSESAHGYAARTSTQQQSSPLQLLPSSNGGSNKIQTTPVKARSSFKNKLATPPNSQRSTLLSPPRSQTRSQQNQFMTDEANNLFLTQSPRAIRTPRRLQGQANASPSTAGAITAASSSTSTSAATSAVAPEFEDCVSANSDAAITFWQDDGTISHIGLDFTEEEPVETESIQGSVDLEKENITPKMSDDSTNPFYVGPSRRQTRSSYSKTDGCTTPTGPLTASSGTITRSKRLALGSISPWRWNTFADPAVLASLLQVKGSKGLGDVAGCKGMSEWVESISQQKGGASVMIPNDLSGASSSSGPGSSSSNAKNRETVASSSIPSSSTLFGPLLPGRSTNTAPNSSTTATESKKLPADHPNSMESAERRSGPSAAFVAKVTETVIQPNSVAFNRRAQRLAGRISYWKHGSTQLLSEQDRQQWPGEWKFEVYQDPESPNSPTNFGEGSSASASHAFPLSDSFSVASAPVPYKGKGKLTERQLSGPSSKRARIHRESLSGGCPESDPTPDQHDGGQEEEEEAQLPPSPSHRAADRQARLKDRYDFRERRLLNSPLTSQSRRL
ncbi:hypothetical protein BX616_000070 [Lobosporangium transversale]|uniref:Uncharacterized protein n=1 Tax=Lobosporangium transversale TaxID=64571 RepID=A0A1Y2GT35_9FUNG|nr:hypothetical protein BCR41DRAFT_24677 [Lobosporangium transversale]KAF9908612.1 hypothetical protein BX616_000070 [Lobosporangium transversale]ORZ21954.1 hypothetical protein BCR41DRAFT_24677 [Lobosporangium transversale]|eukprot:XP_021883205.1 hypothetical protein BCR41DRAFT_24677 [Lobosporangium transversale]